MRKLKRSVAHYHMKKAGLTRVNAPKASGSFFSREWRNYIKEGK